MLKSSISDGKTLIFTRILGAEYFTIFGVLLLKVKNAFLKN